jgi:hypothetical protein
MRNTENSSTSKLIKTTAVAGTAGMVAALLAAAVMLTVGSRQAEAKPEFAQQTGLPCGQCHVSPGGGGKLKAFGQKFKNNGFKVK